MKRHFGFFALAALLVCTALVLGLSACSSGGDDGSALLAVTSGGGGTNTTTTAPETTPTANPVIYTITFNANDGSANPATVTQNFTAGIPQALTSVEELGFSKAGFYFAGWGLAPKSKQAKYEDEASYTAVANETLYALWSETPVYAVDIASNEHGTFSASPAAGIAGTEITLSNTPAVGWRFESYVVTDSGGATVTVTDGKFTMPANNVTVTANFTAIDYNIAINSVTNGDVVATISGSTTPATTANYGQTVKLTATPASDYYRGVSFAVTAADGTAVTIEGSGNVRTFTMPAQNVTISATFESKKTITISESLVGGTIAADRTAAFADETVKLTATPASDYYRLDSFTVIAADGTNITLEGSGSARTFVMPVQDVTISATFESKKTITIPESFVGGTVTADKTAAFSGEIVTFTATPQSERFRLDSITLVTENGVTSQVCITDGSRAFAMPAQNVSIVASFMPVFVPTSYNKINTKTINGVDYDIVEFGDWPQTILPKDSTITIDESKSVVQGDFTYCLGSDGNLYTKVEISAMMRIEKDLRFSDWSAVAEQKGESRWFKVEPINWRVLTTSFDHDGKDETAGKKLLLAEYAIFGSWYYSYKTSGNENDYPTSYARNLLNSVHFLNTAFDSIGVSKIAYTTVDNSARSTEPENSLTWENQWASSPTVDKIFLLSVQEVTRSEYGFINTDDDDAKIRKPTDYARTSGNFCTTWFLRSPDDYLGSDVILVNAKGNFTHTNCGNVRGFVPALCLE